MARALIVEDEAVLRLTFGQFLEEDGYEAITVEDYDEAVRHLDQTDFDLIVTDIILSGKTGVDLLRLVKEREINTPVIMITGEPNIETAADAVRLGAFDYLPKPVTGEALKRVARLAYERQSLTRERDEYATQMDMYRRDLEAVFNSVNDGIITVDAQMRIRQVNLPASTILGLPHLDQTGKPCAEILPPGMESAQKALEQTLDTREHVIDQRIEITIPPEGDKVLIVNTTPLIDQSGVFAGAVLMIRDVTRLTRLEKQIEDTQQYRDMVGKSPKMQEIFNLIRELAETDSTVLVTGASGTGKELVAAALHHSSHRAKGPFLKVNCAALSENILESELFGHVKGAFTSAVKDRVGRFEAANNGTILLDEIGDISPRLQLRLLRVLQEHEFERVGDSTPIRTNVRVIASTNQNLEKKIREGEFRQDLYYRLNVIRIEIPPLHERREDIPLLVEHFCRRFNRMLKKEITGIGPETMDLFMAYPWPGNVRELENCLERAFIVCHDAMIMPRHLPRELLDFDRSSASAAAPNRVIRSGDGLDREHIITVLQQTDWNIAKSSRLLGVARNTLYQKMRALNIVRPS